MGVFGRGLVTLPQMAKAGFLMNVILLPVIGGGLVLLIGPVVFGIEMTVLPSWAK
jgi:hypothetical protein